MDREKDYLRLPGIESASEERRVNRGGPALEFLFRVAPRSSVMPHLTTHTDVISGDAPLDEIRTTACILSYARTESGLHRTAHERLVCARAIAASGGDLRRCHGR